MDDRLQVLNEKRKKSNPLIAQLKGSEQWQAVLDELEYQEALAFESLLDGVSKEVVAATVVILRKLKTLPDKAVTNIPNSKE